MAMKRPYNRYNASVAAPSYPADAPALEEINAARVNANTFGLPTVPFDQPIAFEAPLMTSFLDDFQSYATVDDIFTDSGWSQSSWTRPAAGYAPSTVPVLTAGRLSVSLTAPDSEDPSSTGASRLGIDLATPSSALWLKFVGRGERRADSQRAAFTLDIADKDFNGSGGLGIYANDGHIAFYDGVATASPNVAISSGNLDRFYDAADVTIVMFVGVADGTMTANLWAGASAAVAALVAEGTSPTSISGLQSLFMTVCGNREDGDPDGFTLARVEFLPGSLTDNPFGVTLPG